MIIYQAKTFRIESTRHALERIAERYPDMTQKAVIQKLRSARRATESELRSIREEPGKFFLVAADPEHTVFVTQSVGDGLYKLLTVFPLQPNGKRQKLFRHRGRPGKSGTSREQRIKVRKARRDDDVPWSLIAALQEV